jgi:N utilization substance protein B
MIFQWDASGAAAEKVVEDFFGGLSSDEQKSVEPDRFATKLFKGVVTNSESLDELLRKHAANWTMERMSAVNRNLLRLAIHELRSGETAPAVIIDEAVEIGRRFSGDESTAFINGVLDSVRKELDL